MRSRAHVDGTHEVKTESRRATSREEPQRKHRGIYPLGFTTTGMFACGMPERPMEADVATAAKGTRSSPDEERSPDEDFDDNMSFSELTFGGRS